MPDGKAWREAQVNNNTELYQWQEGSCDSDDEKNVDT